MCLVLGLDEVVCHWPKQIVRWLHAIHLMVHHYVQDKGYSDRPCLMLVYHGVQDKGYAWRPRSE